MAAASQAEAPDRATAPDRPPRRRRIGGPLSWLLFSVGVAVCLVAAAGGVWIYTMPYPLRTYLEARKAARYSPAWAVSAADYRQARALVERKIGWREIITVVTVRGETKIEFGTLNYFQGPMASGGQHFVVERVGGVWTITAANSWES